MEPTSHETVSAIATTAELDASLVRGVAWVAAVRWSTQALTWAATLAIARVLSPGDYGIFSMAVLYLGLLALITEFGLGSAIITIRTLTDEQIAQLNTLSVLLGWAGFLLTCVGSAPLAHFFRAPELRLVLIVMGMGFVISSIHSVPNALLQRDLRFRLISMIELAKSGSSVAIMLPLAFLGARYWTLVAGALAGSFLGAVLTLMYKRHRFAIPNWTELRHAIQYSWQVLVARISWYGYSNSDFLVAGRMLGATVLGYYTLAWNLATLPIDKLTTTVGGVTPGIYSAAQQDFAALRRYLLKPTEVLSLALFPIMAGMALVAKDAVTVLLGAKWNQAILPLELLSVYGCIRGLMPLFGQVLLVVGESKFVMRVNLLSAFLFPVAFCAGSRWGAVGIAATWVVIYPVNALPLYRRATHRIHLRNCEYFAAIWPALHGTVVMVSGVLMLKVVLARVHLPIANLIIQVAGGTFCYFVTLLWFHRDRASMFVRILLLLRG